MPSFRTEIVHQTRLRLLCPVKGGAPALHAFSGRGTLNAYVITILFRMLQNYQRPRKQPIPGQLLAVLQSVTTPELTMRRAQQTLAFRTTVERAWNTLSESDKRILQFRLNRMNIDEVADCLGVHRSTAARRLRDATNRFMSAALTARTDSELVRGAYRVFADEIKNIILPR